MEASLTDMGGQRQPRRKIRQTYGKKKGRLQVPMAEHEIFVQDDHEIEARLATMNLGAAESLDDPGVDKLVGQGQEQKDELPTKKVRKPTLVSEEDLDALEPLLTQSGKDVELFETLAGKLSTSFNIEKIGEGSFAEVFKLTPIETAPGGNKSVAPTSSSSVKSRNLVAASGSSIIKVIPLIHPNSAPNTDEERRSTVESVAREADLLQHLDAVHGFIRFRGVRLVTGSWPAPFLDAFRTFKKRARKRAINDPPHEDFNDNQIYALFEMEDAGTEIDLINRPSVFQVWDIFWMSVILFANAEEGIEFEHRDLHMSNICVRRSSDHGSSLPSSSTSQPVSARADGFPDIDPHILKEMTESPTSRLGLSNLRVTIIDYTIARARLPRTRPPTTAEKASKKDAPYEYHDPDAKSHHIVYSPIDHASDPFHPHPEKIESHLQSLTYRKTRAVAKLRHHHEHLAYPKAMKSAKTKTKTSTSNSKSYLPVPPHRYDKWRAFLPLTNTIWLGYLLRVLIRRARNRTTNKLPLLKGKPGKDGNNKFVSAMQHGMWDVLLRASKVLNGSDYCDVEGEGMKWAVGAGGDDDDAVKHDAAAAAAEEDDDEEEEKEGGAGGVGISGGIGAEVVPTWSEEELTALPSSAREVLRLAVDVEGWLGVEEVEQFRRSLEEES